MTSSARRDHDHLVVDPEARGAVADLTLLEADLAAVVIVTNTAEATGDLDPQ